MTADRASIPYLFLCSLVVYCLSLCLPALNHSRTAPVVDGYFFGIECLVFVPWVMLFPAWWANVAYFTSLSLMVRGRHVAAFWWGLGALLLALTTVCLCFGFFLEWLTHWGTIRGPFGSGYFLWLASMLIVTIGAHLQRRRHSAPRPHGPPSGS